MKGKILITGAAGFIGSHLVELLLKEGLPAGSLRLLIPKNESLKNLPAESFEIIRGDIRDKKIVKKAMEGIEVIYHLAALTIDGGKYYKQKQYQEVNVEGTVNLLEQCRGKKIKKFILFSSIAVYGLPAWVGNINNWSEKQHKNPCEIYGQSKLDAENKLVELHQKWNIPYAIIRPTSVYGPRDKRNLLELYKAIKKHLFFFIGDGKNKMDYVYVKDVARAARLAELSKYKNGDYIIGAGISLTQKEVVTFVSNSLQIVVPNIHISKSIALLLSYIVEFTSKALDIKPLLFPKRVKVLTTNCYFDISKAKKEINYKPETSFEEGAKLTAKWMQNNGLL